KLEFDRTGAAHTPFAHQGSLKLVVQCRGSRAYANYLLEEYLLYRIYNLLTPQSFRARLARVAYVDPSGKKAPATRYAFFLEDDDRMARRNHTHVLAQQGVSQGETNFDQTGLVTVFQYMIGNTDFAFTALHNIVLISDSAGVVYPVPYDFDWSGVISAPYARPDSRLGIATVRIRTYRGTCRTPDDFAPLFARFNAAKDSIYALYRSQPDLEPKRVEQAVSYYGAVYRPTSEARRPKADDIDGAVHCEARVTELEPPDILFGASEPARRLRALADPSRLEPQVELDVDRRLRVAHFPALPLSQFVFAYDSVTVRGGGATPVFHELVLWRRPWALLPLAPVARAVARRYGIAAASVAHAERAAGLRHTPEGADQAVPGTGRQVAVLALAHGRMALCRAGTELRLPTDDGGGEDACRRAL